MGYAQRQQGAPLWLLGESTQVAVFSGHFLITFGVTSLFPFGSLLGHFWGHFLVHFLITFGITCFVNVWVTFGSLLGHLLVTFVIVLLQACHTPMVKRTTCHAVASSDHVHGLIPGSR